MPAKMKIDVKGDKQLDKMLRKFSQINQFKVQDKAVRKAGAVVRQRARQVVPRSRVTGTEEKQSASSRAKWPREIREMIRSKVVKYSFTAVAVIGPKDPEGNAAHFIQHEKGRRHIGWGKFRLGQYRAARDFMRQAFDETTSQQSAAMVASLRADIDKLAK